MLRKIIIGMSIVMQQQKHISIPAIFGVVAQLGERLNGIQEVVGSIPIGSTHRPSVRH